MTRLLLLFFNLTTLQLGLWAAADDVKRCFAFTTGHWSVGANRHFLQHNVQKPWLVHKQFISDH